MDNNRIAALYDRAKKIAASPLTWENKYKMLHSEIVKHVQFEYQVDKTDFESEVTSYMDGFENYLLSKVWEASVEV